MWPSGTSCRELSRCSTCERCIEDAPGATLGAKLVANAQCNKTLGVVNLHAAWVKDRDVEHFSNSLKSGYQARKNLQCFRPDRLRGATSCSHYLSSPGAAITGFHFPFLLRTRECPKCRRVTENVTVPGRSATDSFCSLRPRELQMSR